MSQETAAPTGDVLDMLTSDHREVEQLYEQLASAGATDRAEDQKRIAEQIIAELSVHATVEEQILYPAARDAFAEGDRLVDESLHEHQEMKELLAELDGAGPGEPGFSEDLEKLMDDLRHHVEEEENELFPQLRSALGARRLMEMAQQLAEAKKRAPTRPHPHAPDRPPGNVAAGPVAAAMDKARDAVREAARDERG